MYPVHNLTLTENNALNMCCKLFNALPKRFRFITNEKAVVKTCIRS